MAIINLDKPLFSLHFSRWVFAPKLWPTIGFLMILPILISLGIWQVKRAHFKLELQTQLAMSGKVPPMTLAQLSNMSQGQNYRQLMVTGYYDNQHTMLVDNRIYQHQVGYYVLTPFIPESTIPGNDNRRLLVNRGWIPRLTSRSQLPKIEAIMGRQTILGIIKYPEGREFTLGKQSFSSNAQSPLLIETMQINKISTALKQSMYPFIVLLSPNNTNGYVREWQMQGGLTPQKHWSYAIQWFALALTLFIIYLVVNLHKCE